MVRGHLLRGFFNIKGKQPHTVANEERKLALWPEGSGPEGRAEAIHHPVPTCHASDCLQAILAPPGRAWTIPASGKLPLSLLLWADQ